MVDKNIAREIKIDEDKVDQQVEEALGANNQNDMMNLIDQSVRNFEPGTILTGKIVNHIGDDVVVEVGLKSEGNVSASEFDDPSEIRIGDSVEVLLEAVESDSGLVLLSKRKADRIRGWERIIEKYKEGDTIKGKVSRRIKGGLLVDVGVPVFLPASQVDIRRPGDISEFIGRDSEAKILKIDLDRRNIVVSRRRLLEQTRVAAKNNLLAEIEVGQIRKGVVKNIADFGAFVDLGGLDGLLHITDMSWGRVNHPSAIVKLDEEIEVKILSVDREREKVALGLKQKTESPWVSAKDRYGVNSVVKGQVVNITNYGAFVKLEEGVEGLVHISEMSWTKRVNHPSDLLSVGQEIDVVVLDVNPAKQEVSLGIKQLTENPWTKVAQKYPPGTIIEGRVRNLVNYGAFVEIEEGIDGLLHLSDMSWTRKIGHPGEMLKKGETVKSVVLAVDQEKQRVSLGLKQLSEDPWVRAIPEKYIAGQIVQGRVTKLTNFGVFVELEPDLEGLLHVSELSDEKVETPQDVVKVGQELEVKILRVDTEERKIGLSLKRAQWAAEDQEAEEPAKPAPRGGLDGAAAMGTDVIDSSIFGRRSIQPVSVAGPEEAGESTEKTEESDAAIDQEDQAKPKASDAADTGATIDTTSASDEPPITDTTTASDITGSGDASPRTAVTDSEVSEPVQDEAKADDVESPDEAPGPADAEGPEDNMSQKPADQE